ncbi:DUF2274 domain-containing protein [Sphingobium chlorophenolicum]|uniref:Protein involved in integration/excision of ICE Tn4371 family n=1 Tax=Sphingobium chlorophenolicum TaxID=46429 RepID=A0A081RCE7_SPHCR|nr:DUF2274 domain-containing protein [Sphingobium chlorophenolicum]KEQ52870.1 hypothetical protein BV95_02861 [Sphingobium chlorophenolicum]
MVGLKLPRIPDRTPVKLTILVPPDLYQALVDYATLYSQIYGREEPLIELVPAMLAAFLEGDKAFVKGRAALERRT